MANKEKMQDPNKMLAADVTPSTESMRVSLGDPFAPNIEKTGVKIRGTGCATKGVTARGPMA
jgi:hypothetical protein